MILEIKDTIGSNGSKTLTELASFLGKVVREIWQAFPNILFLCETNNCFNDKVYDRIKDVVI